jgi:23S rRNA (adenine2503-C2)-methyltransferase
MARRDKKIRTDADGKVLLKSLSFDELEQWVVEELDEQKFRAKQIWSWLYVHLASTFEEMTNLSKALRQRLAETARIDVIALNSEHQSKDGTRKLTWKLDSGSIVESVLIPADGRNTLCISSQVGCAMNCQFCYTARMGFHENLSTAEIVDQVVQTRRLFAPEKQLTNVVFMGMGEPFHNPDNVIPASNTLISREGLDLSYRRVTVSTSGLVPEILRFGEESKAGLAVSLNATTDKVRDWVMPINRKYPIGVLMDALREYPVPKGERITFEYVLLRDVNDSMEDAGRLAKLVSGISCKVNLIPFNPHEGTEFQRSPRERLIAFRDYLVGRNINVTVRETRGDDEMAACGQLGQPGEKSPRRIPPPSGFEAAVNG